MSSPTVIERFLLDTSILVHLARKSDLAIALEAKYELTIQPTVPLISIVTAGELYSLAEQSKWGAARIRSIDELLKDLVIVPLDYPGIVNAYSKIDAYCRQNGLPRGENDMWIAATAHITTARLLTTDRDFDGLDPKFIRRDWIDPNTK